MNQPNLQEIKEISILLDKIEQYKKSILEASAELEETKFRNKETEKAEKQKIHDDLKQKSYLQELYNDIEDYRKQAQVQKVALFKKVETEFNMFLDSARMKLIIQDTIKAFDGEFFKIICDPKYKSLIPGDSKEYMEGKTGQIRLSSSTKEYILDPEYLKKILFDQFIISSVSKN
jgi:hypothetical protein